jgi:hypothetical protein
MEPSTDMQIKLCIGYALSDRLAPIACNIVENLKRSTKLIEELPSAAIEAMLDYSKEQHRLDRPRTAVERAYKDVRQNGLEVLWAIGPAAYHTTNASPDRQRLAIGEMTQDAF